MTWAEFKRAVEAAGVTDEHRISHIEVFHLPQIEVDFTYGTDDHPAVAIT